MVVHKSVMMSKSDDGVACGGLDETLFNFTPFVYCTQNQQESGNCDISTLASHVGDKSSDNTTNSSRKRSASVMTEQVEQMRQETVNGTQHTSSVVNTPTGEASAVIKCQKTTAVYQPTPIKELQMKNISRYDQAIEMSMMGGEDYSKVHHDETSRFMTWAEDIMSLVDQLENQQQQRQFTSLGNYDHHPPTSNRLRTHKFNNRLAVNENTDELTRFSYDEACTYLNHRDSESNSESKPTLAVNRAIRPMTWDQPVTYGENVHVVDNLQLFKLEPVCSSLKWKSLYETMSLKDFSFCDYILFIFCAHEELNLMETKPRDLLDHIETKLLMFNTLTIEWIPALCQVCGLSLMRMLLEYVMLINKYQVPSMGYENHRYTTAKHLSGKYPGRYRDLLSKALTNLTFIYKRFAKKIVETKVVDYENILTDLQHLDVERRSCEIVLRKKLTFFFGGCFHQNQVWKRPRHAKKHFISTTKSIPIQQ